ncbi:MAG: hypothetical protein EKD82_08320 [Candidatus Symbiopectobacterium sp. PLON1]|nr:hypothetical protein [Candidatus Symbiopectobacterium sp. PLON1]
MNARSEWLGGWRQAMEDRAVTAWSPFVPVSLICP